MVVHCLERFGNAVERARSVLVLTIPALIGKPQNSRLAIGTVFPEGPKDLGFWALALTYVGSECSEV